ncbi:MAG: hypothetical protein EP335_09550 [Alphaproteobacteria bacterium]|nr:MAG: hypothetical protein EP335_09550 [Alphaproteobacteria bacterium]
MSIKQSRDIFDVLKSDKTTVKASRQDVKFSNSCFAQKALAVPDPLQMRVGKAGGLPFDTLSTDVMTGCLPAELACYGTCFAAIASYKAGYDFGKRVPNIFDEAVLNADFAALPQEQGYVRNGWNSDPSWDWDKAIDLATLTHASGRIMIFISKCFNVPTDAQMQRLIDVGAEIRLSMSAFDTDAYLKHRFEFMHAFREKGGFVIALVITTRFKNPALNTRQDAIVEFLATNDFLAAENSLRVNEGARIIDSLDTTEMAKLQDSTDVWCGRLYEDKLRIPTTTSVPFSYRGLQSPFFSGNDPDFIQSLFFDPVPTRNDVMSGVPHQKPKQCGIGIERTPVA